jgi:hypothetical protein
MTHLTENYQYHRARDRRAIDAIRLARDELVAGKRRYGADSDRVIFNPSHSSHSDRHVRWVENASDGLRLVDFADKIIGLNHQGWFTEDDGDNGEVYRGVVYQLPTRKGKQRFALPTRKGKQRFALPTRKGEQRFAYGYADPNNEGAALLCFDPCDDKEDAAHWADRFAEKHAEEERDYKRAWQAGSRFASLGEEIADARRDCLALIRDTKAGCPTIADLPSVKSTIRAAVMSYLQEIEDARKERAKLKEGDGDYLSFYTGDKRLVAAFNESANI